MTASLPPQTSDRPPGAPARDRAAEARPRASALASLAALYNLTLRQHLHGKRWLVLGALFLTPALLAIVVRAAAPDVPAIVLEFSLVFMFIPQALLPLVALLYGSGIVQDELEEQTFTYLLVRPMRKEAIYTVKLLATLTTAVLLVTVFVALTYVAIYAGAAAPAGSDPLAFRCLKAIGLHALAISAYCCIFGLISLLTRWVLVVGFLYAALFEGLLANLPFSVRLLTVIYYARLLAYRSLGFHLTEPRGGSVDLAAEAWQLNVRVDPRLLEHPTSATCCLVLAIASIVCMALGAYLCGRREFHVKTPEKA